MLTSELHPIYFWVHFLKSDCLKIIERLDPVIGYHLQSQDWQPIVKESKYCLATSPYLQLFEISLVIPWYIFEVTLSFEFALFFIELSTYWTHSLTSRWFKVEKKSMRASFRCLVLIHIQTTMYCTISRDKNGNGWVQGSTFGLSYSKFWIKCSFFL